MIMIQQIKKKIEIQIIEMCESCLVYPEWLAAQPTANKKPC